MLKEINKALRIVTVATLLTAAAYIILDEPKPKEEEVAEGDAVSSEFDDAW